MAKPPTVNNHEAASYISELKEFRNYGDTFTAEWIKKGHGFSTGRMPTSEYHELKNLLKEGDVYVVFSYWTPIGWTPIAGGRPFTISGHRYSPTTGKHQSQLGRGAARFELLGMKGRVDE